VATVVAVRRPEPPDQRGERVRLPSAQRLGRTIHLVAGPSSVAGQPQFPLRGARWAALGALTLFVATGLAFRVQRDTVLAVTAAAIAVGAGALLLRSRRDVTLAYAAVATAGVAFLGNGVSSNVGWFAVCVLSACCVLVGGRRDGLTYLAGALGLLGVEWLWVEHDPGWGPWMAGVTLTTLASILVRHEFDLVGQLRVAQTGLVERSRADERNRIARELHDVIAHTLTVSLLHVTSARLAVEYEPEDAARALAEAERLGRESLAEVRAVVGLLRDDAAGMTEATAVPLPGVDALPALIDRFRLAGTNISLTTNGVQESLTNAVNHAAGAPVTINLSVGAQVVEVVVDSAGDPHAGAGLGLLGMRERAESLGGSFRAGPGGHGWLVRARLPLRTDPQPGKAAS
jgi:signal transduction histidine kinase